jgi:hypothetical protein
VPPPSNAHVSLSSVQSDCSGYPWHWTNRALECIAQQVVLVCKPITGCNQKVFGWSRFRTAGLVQGDPLAPDMYSIVDTRDIAQCARLSAESTTVENGARFLMVGTRGTSPIRIKDLQAKLQAMYPSGATGGRAFFSTRCLDIGSSW